MRGILGVVLVLLFTFFILSQAQRAKRRNKEEARNEEEILMNDELPVEEEIRTV